MVNPVPGRMEVWVWDLHFVKKSRIIHGFQMKLKTNGKEPVYSLNGKKFLPDYNSVITIYGRFGVIPSTIIYIRT